MPIIEYTEYYRQPDLLDIESYYFSNGGKFWIAIEDKRIIGTIALMNKGDNNGVLKKFFVSNDYRGRKIGLALYQTFYKYAVSSNYKYILLDTPSVASASHKFYEKSGFYRTDKNHIPFEYDYPDRDSYLYLLQLKKD